MYAYQASPAQQRSQRCAAAFMCIHRSSSCCRPLSRDWAGIIQAGLRVVDPDGPAHVPLTAVNPPPAYMHMQCTDRCTRRLMDGIRGATDSSKGCGGIPYRPATLARPQSGKPCTCWHHVIPPACRGTPMVASPYSYHASISICPSYMSLCLLYLLPVSPTTLPAC